MKYAGIGSRKTPPEILTIMANIGTAFSAEGFILRSGGALGADSAFASGVSLDAKEIYRPEHNTPESYAIAERFHPAWDRCSDYARALHGRNSLIVLGKDCDDPVDFVVCWTPRGTANGGTGQAIRIAYSYDIPVFNLFNVEQLNALRQLFKSIKE